MTSARALREASTRELREQLVHGHPVDPAALEGWVYRGTSLGLPRVIERLSWKTFQKAFWRDPATGRLLGWNVRLEQDGIDAPSRPRLRNGEPATEWFYEVVSPAGVPMPSGFDRGLVIDYARGDNPLGYLRLVKDPLVALRPGSADELLGMSYLVVGGRCVETPSYFTLVRDHPVDHVPVGSRSVLGLTRTERAWAEGIFAALLGVDALDAATFWRCFDETAAPLVRAGLRPMLHTVTFLPLVSYGRPFFRLDADERERFLAEASASRSYLVRQAVTTLKMLACFAHFDDAAVRARHEGAR